MTSNVKNADGVGVISTPPTVAGNLPKGWMPASSIAEAEFISLPRPRERCRYSNLSRSTLVEMLQRNEIQGVTLRQPGATRGRKLIWKKSLADHLNRLMTEQTEQRRQGGVK
jgi:hypothetical protein